MEPQIYLEGQGPSFNSQRKLNQENQSKKKG